jgi:uncharacterized repeat protein (TIGR03803 family)
MKRLFFRLCAVGCALAPQFPLAATAKEKVVYSFSGAPDGVAPESGLIDVNGTLYGTTVGGGANCQSRGCGTVFALDAKTGAETVLYSFCSQPNCTDGTALDAGGIDVNGTLYGTTAIGGANCQAIGGCGTVFAVNPNTGAETVLYSFCGQQNCTDGFLPQAGLIDVGGILYGTTTGGGANCQRNDFGGCGTVFALDPSSGKETVLYSFCTQKKCRDGSEPAASLIDVKGTLYGTTGQGGVYPCASGYGCGTVFALDAKTGKEKVLHSFGSSGTDGVFPSGALIDVKGTLYGTTSQGGSNANRDWCYYGCGTVFSLDPETGVETVLYAFCPQLDVDSQQHCKDGQFPLTGVIDVKGTFYGTTLNGGAYGFGVLFALDPNTGAETVPHAFGSGTDGLGPWGPLTDATGTLYGVTAGGGNSTNCYQGCGTVYKLRL